MPDGDSVLQGCKITRDKTDDRLSHLRSLLQGVQEGFEPFSATLL